MPRWRPPGRAGAASSHSRRARNTHAPRRIMWSGPHGVPWVGVLSQRPGYLHATPDLAIGQVGVSRRASARVARIIEPARGGAVAKRIFPRSSTAGRTSSMFGCRAHKNSRDHSHLPTKEGFVCFAGGDATLASAGPRGGSQFPLTPCQEYSRPAQNHVERAPWGHAWPGVSHELSRAHGRACRGLTIPPRGPWPRVRSRFREVAVHRFC